MAVSLELARSSKRVGEILQEQGFLTEEQLAEALEYQKMSKGRLGWVLSSLGLVTRIQLFQALADHYGIPLATDIPALERSVQKKYLEPFTHNELADIETVPLYVENGVLKVATAYPDNPELVTLFEPHAEAWGFTAIAPVLITDMDCIRLTELLFKEKMINNAVYGLFFRNPEESAYTVFTRNQVYGMLVLAIGSFVWMYFDVVGFLVFSYISAQMLYIFAIGFKLILSLAGGKHHIEDEITPEQVAALRDDDLPVYSVLVPVYNEPEVVGILMQSIKNMDYPQNKLDVLLLLEENDSATLEAAKKNRPPANWRFIIVPNCQPKTKPKACNYGLLFARGEYVVIYDAEDIPEPDQLKKAVVSFRTHTKDYICFQAALNYFNKDENFLTKMFTLEYSYWYDYLLPGVDKLGLPIPLGGTSNHFDTAKLRKLGAWDPFNTTEDADLGTRAYAEGYKVGIINSTTFEEANARLGNWIRQRSRWVKGYMQTWLVYSRKPLTLMQTLGFRGWFSFNLFVGGTPAIFLINPLMWGFFLVWLVTGHDILTQNLPPFVVWVSIANFIAGNFMGLYLNMLAVYRRGYYKLLWYALFNPFYWLLHSFASYKALWQLFTKPFYWEKTQHGITKVKVPGKAEH